MFEVKIHMPIHYVHVYCIATSIRPCKTQNVKVDSRHVSPGSTGIPVTGRPSIYTLFVDINK